MTEPPSDSLPALDKILDDVERRAIKPPDKVSIVDWVNENRVLDPIHSSEPGPYDCDVTPYVRGILEAYADRHTREIVLMGGTQWGKTETLLNCLLWSIVQDPKLTLFVLPTEEQVAPFCMPPLGRLALAIQNCLAARDRHLVTKEHEVQFDAMILYFGWSGSPITLAGRSIGNLFLDEVDKFQAFSGQEADPISLARERLRWYPDSKLVAASTPTTTDGYVWRLWQRSDQRWYWVPCVVCGRHFRLEFFSVVHWPPDERDAERIRKQNLAWVECPHCASKIADTPDHRRRMMLGGVWCPDGGEVVAGGEVRGADLDAPRKGYHLNALYSPRLSWSDVVAEFIESKDDQARLLNWTNAWRGWPWVEQTETVKMEHLLALRTSVPAGRVASGAIVLTAGVDVQKGLFYYTIRAWGVGERSWLVVSGSVEQAETLCEILFHTPYLDDQGQQFTVRLACIDSGYETDAVYDLCSMYPDVARPTKGHRAGRLSAGVPIRATRIRRDWIGRATSELLLWNLDVTYFQDKLSRMLRTPLGAPGAWALNAEPSDEHLRHMLAERRILVRDRKRKTMRSEWKADGPNHLRDTEVYALAAADMLGVWTLRDDAAGARAASSYRQVARHVDADKQPAQGRRRRFQFRDRRQRE